MHLSIKQWSEYPVCTNTLSATDISCQNNKLKVELLKKKKSHKSINVSFPLFHSYSRSSPCHIFLSSSPIIFSVLLFHLLIFSHQLIQWFHSTLLLCEEPWSLYCMSPYCSSEVDGHQWVWRQEKVVESQGVFELWQHVAKPCNEPWQRKDGSHLRSARNINT